MMKENHPQRTRCTCQCRQHHAYRNTVADYRHFLAVWSAAADSYPRQGRGTTKPKSLAARISRWEGTDGLRFVVRFPRGDDGRLWMRAARTGFRLGPDLTQRLVALAWAARVDPNGPYDLVVRSANPTELRVWFQPARRSGPSRQGPGQRA